MAKRLKITLNYFVITDTVTSVEELRDSKENITYKEDDGNISFYQKSTGLKKSVNNYTVANTVNGDDSDNPFADLAALKLYLDTNTGFNTPEVAGEIIETSIDVNPVSPNITYLIDASAGVVTMKLPNVVSGNKDTFKFVLDKDGNHTKITTVGGTQLIGDTIIQEIATIRTSITVQADGVNSYKILNDNREYYRNTIVTTNLDLSNGYESGGIYVCKPPVSTEIIITIPDVDINHKGLYAKFILAIDNGGSVRLKTLSGEMIGIELEPVIMIQYTSFELEDTGFEYLVTQDSRPHAQLSSVIFYGLTEASVIPTYLRVATSTTDPDYSQTPSDQATSPITSVGQLVASFASDEGVIQGLVTETNLISVANWRRVSGSGTGNIYAELYKRDTGGTETLLTTTNTTPEITNSIYIEYSISAIVPETNFLPTDRVVIKVYINRIAGGSDPVYEIQLEGTNPARLTLAVPSSTIAHNSLAGVNPASTNEESGHIDNKYPLQFPELTTIERDAIVSPNNGMKIFNLTEGVFQKYQNGVWKPDDLTAYKTADETKTNDDTLTLDNNLQVELEANSTYSIKLLISYSTVGGTAINLGLKEIPIGAVLTFHTDLSSNSDITRDDTYGFAGSTSDVIFQLYWIGNITTTNTGTFGVKWSQLFSGASGVTIKKESWMELIKLN